MLTNWSVSFICCKLTTDSISYPAALAPLQLVWLVAFGTTLLIGLDVGLGIGVIFSILVVIFKTVLPFSPEIGEAKAWHYLPQPCKDENFDHDELKVILLSLICVMVTWEGWGTLAVLWAVCGV